MSIAAGIRRFRRGPLRTRLRAVQSRFPPAAAGRTAAPPDFVGIGAQRCGTSWWQSLIEEHPRVTPLGLGAKELHFFDGFWAREVGDADAARYRAQFLRRPGYVCGEWTPRYLHDPWAVPALLRVAPEARLLVMVRDPVARFRSALRHAEQRRGGADADLVTDAYQRGCYAAQLVRVLDLVPREQLLVLQFERCARDPAPALARTFDFLGLPTARVDVTGSRNASRPAPPAPGALVDEVRARYRADAEQLAALFPDEVDLDLWTELQPDPHRG